MQRLSHCTVVLEFNYQQDPSVSMGSVWVFPADASEFLDESEESLESSPGWTRIAGPIEYKLAAEIQSTLVDFLRANGVKVVDEGVAD